MKKVYLSMLGTMLILLILQGCATPPFKPKSDIRISGISSNRGHDEISAELSLAEANLFPYQPAVIQFSLNNGVGVTLTDYEISYSPAEDEAITYIDSNGTPQTGIPTQKSKIQKHFNSNIPLLELIVTGGEGPLMCCLNINLVTSRAYDVLSVDGSLLTKPNYNANIIANLTIRGIDDNDNAFKKSASIAITPNLLPVNTGQANQQQCDDRCTAGPSSVELPQNQQVGNFTTTQN